MGPSEPFFFPRSAAEKTTTTGSSGCDPALVDIRRPLRLAWARVRAAGATAAATAVATVVSTAAAAAVAAKRVAVAAGTAAGSWWADPAARRRV